jgi:hypothetical protein
MAQSRRQKRKARRRQVSPTVSPAEGARSSPPAVAGGSPPQVASRSEKRNQALRESLEPLAPGERPRAVTVGAFVALASAPANAVYAIVTAEGAARIGPLVLSVLLLAMAWGMWRARYWAVLGMQALLGLTIVLVAVNVFTFAGPLQAVVGVAVIVPCGVLFWFLVKALARIQMPSRPGQEAR